MTKPPEVPPELREFTAQLPFTLDEFQLSACRALETRPRRIGVRTDRRGQDGGG